RYILQRVNTRIFKRPEELMENISAVTGYLAPRCAENECLHLVPTTDGACFFCDDTGFYRMYDFVEASVTYQKVENDYQFFLCGKAFGAFQKQLADFDASVLHEVIPDFHNTAKRLRNFKKALSDDRSGRAKNAVSETEFILGREKDCGVLTDMLASGKLKTRVTHNDTKLNNILFSASTGDPMCVIDLDTVMPGLSLYDFGDSIRFGASTAAEDEKDLTKVHFSLDLFETYAKGYLESCNDVLCEEEKLLMPFGAKIMTLECGMRFLADYFDGDVYFKTAYPEHNLVRCRTQLRLVAEMEEQQDAMIAVIKKYI
ncbi:MAG TPA: aminoglycoside phosphotransferase family protein, partial [Bacillota bacterium]|nr:aminoglycoside phosphotransferase family protein [Bacillota bacterium]